MEDLEVIEAFVNGGARRAFGPTLHIEGDCLFFDGWWQAAYRIGPEAFALRNEDPPQETPALDDIASALTNLGLEQVGIDPPLVQAVTYAEIALGLVSWAMWSTDAAAADAALHTRIGKDEFFDTGALAVSTPDFSAELGGARRLAGLPASLILSVGVDSDQIDRLRNTLDDCRFEIRALDGIDPEVCGSLIPTLVLVDATGRPGEEFIMRLRAVACGRTVPVVAVTPATTPPLGADAAVDPSADVRAWADPIRHLLP